MESLLDKTNKDMLHFLLKLHDVTTMVTIHRKVKEITDFSEVVTRGHIYLQPQKPTAMQNSDWLASDHVSDSSQ